MTMMVACARGPEEVECLVRGGVDAVLLDRLDDGASADLAAAIRQTVALVGGRVAVWVMVQPGSAAALAGLGVAALVAPAGPGGAWFGANVVREPASPCRMFALFGDGLPDRADLDAVRAAAASGVVFGSATRTVDAASPAELAAFADGCRQRGLTSVLAGGLEAPDVPRLVALGFDALVFRRALCVDGRSERTLDPDALLLIRDLVPRMRAPGLGPPGAPAIGRAASADRIFVRDLVLPVAVGAYVSESGRRQRVRFTVEADLAPLGRPAKDMRDIVSYDLIADAIKQQVATGHVALVETLAEQIAARILTHDRVLGVRVMVEKLDLGPGSVGVEIWRDRGGPAGR